MYIFPFVLLAFTLALWWIIKARKHFLHQLPPTSVSVMMAAMIIVSIMTAPVVGHSLRWLQVIFKIGALIMALIGYAPRIMDWLTRDDLGRPAMTKAPYELERATVGYLHLMLFLLLSQSTLA